MNDRNPHNHVESTFSPTVVAVVGGTGAMGRRLVEEFRRDGYEVRVSGQEPLRVVGPNGAREWQRALRRWNSSICKGADVVLFAVPIPAMEDETALKNIFGRTPPRGWRDKLVIDVCSTKVGPLRALAELRGATVIGTHPMFGPSVRSFAGQTVFVCPVSSARENSVLGRRMEVRMKWLRAFWERRGVQVVDIEAEDHDAFVPAVQFGVLLPVIVYAEGLRRSKVDMEAVRDRGTPNSRIMCTRIGRMISTDMLATYTNLTLDNPMNREWIEHAIQTLTEIRGWMESGDRQAMMSFMQRLVEHQPPAFREHFSAISTFLDSCLAKRELVSSVLAKS